MTVVQVVLSNMAVNTDVLAPVTFTLDTLKTPCSKLGYLILVICQRPLVAQSAGLRIRAFDDKAELHKCELGA